jgi:uncharacterized protein (DUF4213/DUF364 family)
MLANELVDYGLKVAARHKAVDIRIGLGYTAVCLEDNSCGLAYTLHEKEYESCSVIPDAGSLKGRKASELIPWMTSPDVTASAVGLATLNALIHPSPAAVEADVLDLVPVGQGDTVGMIGYFGPLVEPLKKEALALHIFERKPDPEYGILPEAAAQDLLPQCHVVIMSATTLLNHTIDGLLGLAKTAREIAVLGPSTPFLPEIFSRHGVTMLSGLQVTDPARILQIVSEAGGTRQFLRAARKLSLRCRVQ